MSRVLRSIAISTGTALAKSFGAVGRTSRPVPAPGRRGNNHPAAGPTLVPKPETLQQRLDRLEARIAEAEASNTRYAETLDAVARIELRIDAQESRFHDLRIAVEGAEKRSQIEAETAQKNFGELKNAIPGLVATAVTDQIAGLELRLRAEADASWNRSLEYFENTIEQKVADRLASLERVLIDQSASIHALRLRAEETDSNLQRLVVAVERICDRGVAPVPVAAEPVLEIKAPGAQSESGLRRSAFQGMLGAVVAFGIARLLIA